MPWCQSILKKKNNNHSHKPSLIIDIPMLACVTASLGTLAVALDERLKLAGYFNLQILGGWCVRVEPYPTASKDL